MRSRVPRTFTSSVKGLSHIQIQETAGLEALPRPGLLVVIPAEIAEAESLLCERWKLESCNLPRLAKAGWHIGR